MPDFTANIVLDIDDSKLKSVEDRLNNLEKSPINIKLDIDQSALNNVLNLSGSGIKSLSATGQKAGLKLGAGIQNGLKIATKVPVIKNGTLKSLNQYTDDVLQNNKNIINEAKKLKTTFPKAKDADLLKSVKGYYSGIEKEVRQAAKIQENAEQSLSKYADRIREKVNYGDYDAQLSKLNSSLSKYPNLTDANPNYKSAYDAYKNMQRISDKLKSGLRDDGTLFNDDDYAKLGKEFQGQSNVFSNSMSMISDEMSQVLDTSKRFRAQADISSLMEKNGRATEKYGTEMVSLQKRAESLNTNADYKRWKEDFEKIKTGITVDGLTGNSISEYADRIREKVNYGDYDAQLSKLNSSLSKYPNLTDANPNYKSAYDAYKNMQRINEKLKLGKHDDGTIFSNDDYAKFGKEFQGQSKLFSNSMSIISDEMSQAIDVSKRLKAQADISSLMDKNGRATKKYGTEMESLQQRAANLTTDSDYKQWREDFAKVKTGITLDGLGGNSVFSQLKKGLSSITRYIGISEVLHASVNTAKQMVQAVRDVDTAMTGLYKVTDNTKQEYDQFYKSAQKSAVNLGRTTSSYIDQTATWAKLGYTLKDSADLAKTSSIYANVGEVDDATAVSDIVTALKAFNFEASDSIRVVDSLNQLGNRFAVSSADLGTGLAKSASAMAASGNDMYQTLAMLTGGGEITQNVGELGNALKVVGMRIMGQKGALEEIGEEYEDIQEVSKIQGQIYNLTKGTVNIMDEANPTKFKSTYEILQGVANIIDDLNGTDRANLTEILFGKMRGNQGLAILSAFKSGQVQKAYEEAVNSAGSAQQEQDRWMESLDAKIQQFQSSFQNLSNTAISSDFLKGIVDGGTSALNILTQIIDKVGILKPLLAGFGAAAFFKNLDRPEITGVQANFPIS